MLLVNVCVLYYDVLQKVYSVKLSLFMQHTQTLMKPDSKRLSVTSRKESRLDATLGTQNISCDVHHCQLKYTSRYSYSTFAHVIYSNFRNQYSCFVGEH